MEDDTEALRGELLNKAVSFASAPALVVDVEGVAEALEARRAWSAPADSGLGPGKDPLLPSAPVAILLIAVEIEPRRPPVALVVAPPVAGVASSEPRRGAETVPAAVATVVVIDALLSPGM